MSVPRARLAASAAVALVVAAAGVWRARDLGPSLVFEVGPGVRRDDGVAYRVTITTRGGETLDEMRLVPAPGMTVEGPSAALRLRPGVTFVTTIQVGDAGAPTHLVVRQKGRVEREYDLDLAAGVAR